MKAIIGVDAAGGYLPGLDLFVKLAFQGASATAVSAMDTTPPIATFAPEAMAIQADFVSQSELAAKEATEHAVATLRAANVAAEANVLYGGVAPSLIRAAEDSHADLVVIHNTPRPGWQAFLLGSVSKALVTGCPTSVLISKGNGDESTPLTAIFATDHSDYATRALDRFLQLAPKGIGKIHVVTAYEVDDLEAQLIMHSLPALTQDMAEWVREKLSEKSAAVTERLREAGYDATFSVINGDPNEVIRDAVKEQNADLAVLGAQGHGFFERILTGSVALHQAVSEPHSVLLVRA
jgi:nucleotide-binding universal stress UspA family protein